MRFILLLCLGTFSWFANAQTKPSNKTKEELLQISLAAETFFQSREHQSALEAYLLLYQETDQSEMLFNAAQCQRFLNHYTTSIELYNAYLQAQISSPKRKAIDEVVVEMKQKLQRQAEQRKKAKRRKLVLFGGSLLTSLVLGSTSLVIAREAKEQEKNNLAIALNTITGVSLATSGVSIFFALHPKRSTYD
jgi:hypothetical protein